MKITKEQALAHLNNGGQFFRTVKRKTKRGTEKEDKFFYKIENGELLCRCNEVGGWNKARCEPRWETDNIQVATEDYISAKWDGPITIKPLPLLIVEEKA